MRDYLRMLEREGRKIANSPELKSAISTIKKAVSGRTQQERLRAENELYEKEHALLQTLRARKERIEQIENLIKERKKIQQEIQQHNKWGLV